MSAAGARIGSALLDRSSLVLLQEAQSVSARLAKQVLCSAWTNITGRSSVVT